MDDCCFRKLKVVKKPYSIEEVSTPTPDLAIPFELIENWPCLTSEVKMHLPHMNSDLQDLEIIT